MITSVDIEKILWQNIASFHNKISKESRTGENIPQHNNDNI